VPRNRKNNADLLLSLSVSDLLNANNNSPTEDRRSARANARGGGGDSSGV